MATPNSKQKAALARVHDGQAPQGLLQGKFAHGANTSTCTQCRALYLGSESAPHDRDQEDPQEAEGLGTGVASGGRNAKEQLRHSGSLRHCQVLETVSWELGLQESAKLLVWPVQEDLEQT